LEEAAAQSEIEQADDAFPVERQRPRFELLEATGGARGADHCTHRASGDEIGYATVFGKRQQHTDMRPAARRAAAKRNSESGSTGHRHAHNIGLKSAWRRSGKSAASCTSDTVIG